MLENLIILLLEIGVLLVILTAGAWWADQGDSK